MIAESRADAPRSGQPFLARAHAITIISVNEAQTPASPSATTLAAHLARHGLTAYIERSSADRADIQATILSIAADTGTDLIVMGAYGHARLQERILGGLHAACFNQ
jgi:nucleotide-binding universal stress UspA family protein